MNRLIIGLFCVMFVTGVNLFGKTISKADTVTVAFWNVENLFDAIDDPAKDDAEFLPTAESNWTNERLDEKFSHLAKVINAMNNGRGPDVMGFGEVEHQALLDELIAKYFNNKDYGVVYAESPDARGIDVGLIYNKDKFKLAWMKADTVILPDKYATRLILNANLIAGNNDSIHFFVNHWPSRRGGQEKSDINRIAAAKVLEANVQNLFGKDAKTKIIIMGDFNDNPDNSSIKEILKATGVTCDSVLMKPEKGLTNLAYRKFSVGQGSYFYAGKFDMIDQMIVSNNILTGKSVNYICESFDVFKPAFMVTETGKYKGAASPTYGGKKYLGGYSDHFPVTAKFVVAP